MSTPRPVGKGSARFLCQGVEVYRLCGILGAVLDLQPHAQGEVMQVLIFRAAIVLIVEDDVAIEFLWPMEQIW